MTRRGLIAIVLAGLCLSSAGVAQTILGFPVPPPGGPTGIALGADDALWFTEVYGNKIGRITTGGVLTDFPVPTASAGVLFLAPGPDGALWFTETTASKIGRITTAGTVTEYPLAAGVGPFGITAGSDGNLWFAAESANKIGRITAAGTVTYFPATGNVSLPTDITSGSDGALWFTEYTQAKIGRITTAGIVTYFSISAGQFANRITAGPDGALWFTEVARTPMIGRMTTAGVLTEFPITSGSYPGDIVGGPDGALWFTEAQDKKIGRITTAGSITEFALPAGHTNPGEITAGPDGALWSTESDEVAWIGPGGDKFHTLTPCRVADTRAAAGPYGGPALAHSSDRSFLIRGQCGIPATSSAVAFNFTVTQPTHPGDVRVFPVGTIFSMSSTLNWKAGQTRANNAIISLGPTGTIVVRNDQSSGTAHVLIDVSGYFE